MQVSPRSRARRERSPWLGSPRGRGAPRAAGRTAREGPSPGGPGISSGRRPSRRTASPGCRAPFRRARRTAASAARPGGAARRARRPTGFPRSTASAYWMRSFVPMLRKVDLARQEIGGHRGGRGFDHRAQGHVGAAQAAPAARSVRGLARQDASDLAHLVDRRHEREQDAHVGMRRSAQERAELRDEDLRALQAQAQAAEAQNGIRLGPLEHFVEVLLASQVEGADDDGMRRHAIGEVAIGPVMVVFVGQAPAPARRRGTPSGTARSRARRSASRRRPRRGTRCWRARTISTPSRVTVGRSRVAAQALLARHPEVVLRPSLRRGARVSGSTTTSPRSPSTITIAPGLTLRAACSQADDRGEAEGLRQGSPCGSSARLDRRPSATTPSLANATVSDGPIVCATTTMGPSGGGASASGAGSSSRTRRAGGHASPPRGPAGSGLRWSSKRVR